MRPHRLTVLAATTIAVALTVTGCGSHEDDLASAQREVRAVLSEAGLDDVSDFFIRCSNPLPFAYQCRVRVTVTSDDPETLTRYAAVVEDIGDTLQSIFDPDSTSYPASVGTVESNIEGPSHTIVVDSLAAPRLADLLPTLLVEPRASSVTIGPSALREEFPVGTPGAARCNSALALADKISPNDTVTVTGAKDSVSIVVDARPDSAERAAADCAAVVDLVERVAGPLCGDGCRLETDNGTTPVAFFFVARDAATRAAFTAAWADAPTNVPLTVTVAPPSTPTPEVTP